MGMDKVICVDLDGTLFYPPRRVKMISDGNKKFIDRFLDDGGRLVLVSGRNLYTPMKVGEVLGRDIDVIGCNGSFVLSGGHYVKEAFFEKEFAKSLIKEVGREFPVRLTMLFTKHRNIVMPLSGVGSWTGFCYSVYQLSQMAYRDPVIRSDKAYYEELEKGEIYKIMFFFGIAGAAIETAKNCNKELRERYPGAEWSWCRQAIEITPAGCSKDSGIASYLEYNKIDKDNVLVVGDSGNDISMFEAYQKNSFCMEHSPDAVKKHAAHVVKRFYDLEKYLYPSEESNKPLEKGSTAKQ